jgi:CHRD domain
MVSGRRTYRERPGGDEVLSVKRVGVVVCATAIFVAGVWAGVGAAGHEEQAAAPIGLTATLGARQEVPKPTAVRATATGRFVVTLVRSGATGRLAWRLTYSGLTGRGTAAHIHLGATGRSGPVAISLCGPCRSGARGTARANGGVVAALLAGRAYVNVHTAKNPAGEIRGQIKRGAVVLAPPPGTTGTTTTTTTTSPTYTTPPTDPY